MRRRDAGFTLLELVIALAIVGALLVVAFGGLRVGIAAWNQGEERAEGHQELRGVALLLARAVGGAFPYRGSLGLSPEPVLLFRGAENRLELVTQTAPFPAGTPAAFTAVVLAIETPAESGERPELVVRQRVLPNRNPFSDAEPALRDPGVQSLKFGYLGESSDNTDTDNWKDTWDAENENALPRAVRMTLTTVRNGRTETSPPITVPLWLTQ